MPRANFANVGTALAEVNASMADFAQKHNIPPEHFHVIPTEVHPVAKSAVRKLLILSTQTVEFLDDIR